jgi:hypothetical protein
VTSPAFARLRQAAARAGLEPARFTPEASEGRALEAVTRHSRLVEGTVLASHLVGEAEAWPDPVAFLDGTQHYEIIAYDGASSIFAAEIGAAVRERRNRRLTRAVGLRRRLVVGRRAALDSLGALSGGFEAVAIPEDDPPHPVRDQLLARRVVDDERGRLEIEAGGEYRKGSDGWLIVDGSLAQSPLWAADPRMVGVVKSHSALPFDGEDLVRYLRLPCFHRSSVFASEQRMVAPVYSWALRLWPWEGKDLLHGLVRIEAAPTAATIGLADQLSRWLLAERAPVSAPDPRWDRMLYGIRAVEVGLKGER